MKAFYEKLHSLNKENPEERLMYQVMDLEWIKYKGMQTGDIVMGDEVYQSIERCIKGFMWLYEKGYSLEKSVEDKLEREDDIQYYQQFLNAFSVVNEFMTQHMYLKSI